jgi:hypothetical protein
MTNKLALFFAVIIIAIFVADHYYFHWDLHISLGKRLVQLSEYIAFWR